MKSIKSISRFMLMLTIALSLHAADKPATLGTNVSGVSDWATQLIFVDVMKTARPWIPQMVSHWTWDTGETLDLDSDGWIKSLEEDQAAGTLLLIGQNGHYPAGDYICLYDGEGELQFSWDARIKSQSPGRMVIEVTPSDNGIYIKQTATNPADPMRCIRLIMPGYEDVYETQPFFPPVLDILGNFSNLRFMWWNNAVDSPVREWTERTPVTSATYQRDSGVPYEIMIQLANTLNTDPWFCLPHLASDDYVRQFAELINSTLDPELTAYVEYGNEVWNGIYQCAVYAREQGLALGLSDNDFTAQMRFHSQRSVEIFNICKSVMPGEGRLMRVLGGWSQQNYTAEVVLGWQNAWQYADAYAIAPYFGHDLGAQDQADRVKAMSAAEIVAEAAEDMPRVMQANVQVYNTVKEKGLDFICYEAGQHIVFNSWEHDTVLDSLFQAANRHPDMYDVYMEYYSKWDELFGDLMVTYASCEGWGRYGSWGLLERWNQPVEEAPKYRATLDFLEQLQTGVNPSTNQPDSFTLLPAWPNPFNPSTRIQIRLNQPEQINIFIYNSIGQFIAELKHEILQPGLHSVAWDASAAGAGVYLVKASAGTKYQTQKLLLLK